MKKKLIIAAVVLVAIAGLMFARTKAIKSYSEETALFESRGNYAKAVDTFNKVVFLENIVPFNPNKAAAYVYRGRLYFNNGNTNQALEDLNNALRADKNNAEANFGIALILLAEGDLKQAVKKLDLVIKQNPKWVEAYLSRQVAYRKLGEKDKAIADLKQVLKIDPKNEGAKAALRMIE